MPLPRRPHTVFAHKLLRDELEKLVVPLLYDEGYLPEDHVMSISRANQSNIIVIDYDKYDDWEEEYLHHSDEYELEDYLIIPYTTTPPDPDYQRKYRLALLSRFGNKYAKYFLEHYGYEEFE